MPDFWRSKKDKEQTPPDDEPARESKLAGFKPMHFEPDDEAPTREDKQAERPRSVPGVPGL